MTLQRLLIVSISLLLLSNAEELKMLPPMGFNSWTAFFCEIDCDAHPNTCINEMLYQEMADIMVVGGYKDAGYRYVNIDDCWMEKARDKAGKLVADRARFPSGIKGLADFMHKRGMRLGLYEDVGTATCAGYPGSFGHYRTDAESFAEWNIDYIKIDGCNLDQELLEITHLQMKKALANTNHTMVYSCEWPLYNYLKNKTSDYKKIAATCNVFRNWVDMGSSWQSITSIINYMTSIQDVVASVQKPGAYNDPDMLVIGDENITVSMARTQMTVWCIWSVPLMISTDLRKLDQAFKDILINKEAISVNQDSYVKFGKVVRREGDLLYFVKPINPLVDGEYSYAVAVVNLDENNEKSFTVEISSLGLGDAYEVTEIWSNQKIGRMAAKDYLSAKVQPADSLFYKFIVANKISNRIASKPNVIDLEKI